MYVIIDEMTGVYTYDTWFKVKKNHSLEKEDFKQFGKDYVCNLSGENFEVSKDIKILERAAIDKAFGKRGLGGLDIISIITFILVLIMYFSLGDIPSEVLMLMNKGQGGVQ